MEQGEMQASLGRVETENIPSPARSPKAIGDLQIPFSQVQSFLGGILLKQDHL